MPVYAVLHEGYALTLGALGNDGGGHSLGFSCFLESRTDLIEIMGIDADHMEIEGFELFVDGIRVIYFRYGSVDLQTVVINDDNKVIQLLAMSRRWFMRRKAMPEPPASREYAW